MSKTYEQLEPVIQALGNRIKTNLVALAGKADADDVTAINDSIGDLSQLETVAKDNLVSAITELKNDTNEITADLLSICDYTASVNLFNASAELDSSYHSVNYNISKNVITLDGTVSSGGTKKFTFGTDLDSLGLSIGDYVTMSYKIVKGTTNKNLSFSLNSVAGTYVYVNTSASPATSVTFQFTAEMTNLGIYFGNGAVIDDLEIELQIEAGQTPTAIMAKGEDIITGAKDTVAREAISQLPDYNTLPDYWETYLKARIPEINAYSVPSIGKWDRFIFITDIHLQYQNRTYKSAGHSNKILARLMNECNLGMIVFGGDALTSDYQSQQDTIDALSEFRNYYSNVWEHIYCVDGNHDTGGNNKDTTTIGDWTTLNHSVVFEMLAQDKLKQYESVGSGGGSYYFDNKACKIRYIFLWHNYANNYQDMTWLTNVLNATESGWTIVVFTHYSLSDANTIDSKLSATNRVIDTLNAYDGSATIAGVIGGHAHTISSAVYTAKGYPVICSNSDLYNVGDASRTKGNITEHSMEVVQIDTETKKITLHGVGFSDTGTEREYTYV